MPETSGGPFCGDLHLDHPAGLRCAESFFHDGEHRAVILVTHEPLKTGKVLDHRYEDVFWW